jgi:hypothetical protein
MSRVEVARTRHAIKQRHIAAWRQRGVVWVDLIDGK